MKKILCPNCKKVLVFETCGKVNCLACKRQIFISVIESDRKIFGREAYQEKNGEQLSYFEDEMFVSKVMDVEREEQDDSQYMENECAFSSQNTKNETIHTLQNMKNETMHNLQDTKSKTSHVPQEIENITQNDPQEIGNGTQESLKVEQNASVAKTESEKMDNLTKQKKQETDNLSKQKKQETDNLSKQRKQEIDNLSMLNKQEINKLSILNKQEIDSCLGEYIESELDMCESEVILLEKEKRNIKLAKQKKNKRRMRISQPLVSAVAVVVAVIILLVAPFGEAVVAGEKVSVAGAKYIGIMLTQMQPNSTSSTILASILGGLIAATVLTAVVYAIFSFKVFGSYSRKMVTTANAITMVLGTIATIMTVLCVVLGLQTGGGVVNGQAACGGLIACAIIICVMIANAISRLRYKSSKHIVLSPKKTQYKAYIIFSGAIFFVSSLTLSVVATQGGNVARSILSKVLPSSSPILSNLAIYSSGMTKKMLSFMFFSDPNFVSATANQTYFSYASIVTGFCLFALVIIYIFYINRSKEIFVGKVKSEDCLNKFREDDFEQKLLSKFLKKNTWLTFAIFALVLTAELASNIFLYLGSEQLPSAIFCMLCGVAVLAVQCCPYAMFAREQYMQAFYEFDDMGAEVAPIEKRRLRAVTIVPIVAAFAVNILYTIFVFV